MTAHVSGLKSVVENNGGIYVRSDADGFWSGWLYIPYIYYGANATFWASSSSAGTSVGNTYHANLTRIQVKRGSSNMTSTDVDVRGGRNSLFSSLLSPSTTGLRKKTNQSGYIEYRIPYTPVYPMVTYNNWDYIASFLTQGTTLTINIPTSPTCSAIVKRGGTKLSNRPVAVVHEAFFNNTNISYLNFQAHPNLLATNSNGSVSPYAQEGYPIAFIAFDENGVGHISQHILYPSTSSSPQTKVLIYLENTPTLSAPANNATKTTDVPVSFNWGTTTNAVVYVYYLADSAGNVLTYWAQVDNSALSVTFNEPGNYKWCIQALDSEGDQINKITWRNITVVAASPKNGNNSIKDTVKSNNTENRIFINKQMSTEIDHNIRNSIMNVKNIEDLDKPQGPVIKMIENPVLQTPAVVEEQVRNLEDLVINEIDQIDDLGEDDNKDDFEYWNYFLNLF